MDDHRAVADALRDRDAGVARAAMQAHLSNVMEELFTATETEVVQKAKEEINRKRSD